MEVCTDRLILIVLSILTERVYILRIQLAEKVHLFELHNKIIINMLKNLYRLT